MLDPETTKYTTVIIINVKKNRSITQLVENTHNHVGWVNRHLSISLIERFSEIKLGNYTRASI